MAPIMDALTIWGEGPRLRTTALCTLPSEDLHVHVALYSLPSRPRNSLSVMAITPYGGRINPLWMRHQGRVMVVVVVS